VGHNSLIIVCNLFVYVVLGNQWFCSLYWHDQRFGQTLGSLKRGLWTPYCFLCKTYYTEDQFSSKGTFYCGVI